jgi:hypothetical protein
MFLLALDAGVPNNPVELRVINGVLMPAWTEIRMVERK